MGYDKCYIVDFEECKDANEYLVKYGKASLQLRLNNAWQYPIEGVFSLENFESDLDLLFEVGLQKASTLDIEELDKLISWDTGRLYTITGIPSHGKSEFVDFICELLNIKYKWKVGYFSPENHPLQLHTSKIIEKISGKEFNKKYINIDEYKELKNYVNENYFFINPKENFTVDNILDSARQLVERKGIKVLILDPYNKFDHNVGTLSETSYISSFLDKLTVFAQKNNVLVFLVAHPTKMRKENGIFEVPNLYSINGSANFYNKTDFGITIYRDFNTNIIEVHIQKVKFKHLGEVGMATFKYNINNGRFVFYDVDSMSDIINWDNRNHLKEEKLINKKENIQLENKFTNFYEPNENKENESYLPF